MALEKQVLIVSLGAKLKVNKCKDIRDWFLANKFADFGDPFTNFFLPRRLPKGFVDDDSVQKKVIEYFASFDEHIKDFEIEKVSHDTETKEETYKISALHKKIDSDEFAAIPLGMESAGTLKMFALYPELQDVLEKGSVFFIDELNARLHPLLVRNFLLTFLNPEINTNHVQLIFTTHDTWQLSNQLLRRDEVWFTEKDGQGISKLYSLSRINATVVDSQLYGFSDTIGAANPFEALYADGVNTLSPQSVSAMAEIPFPCIQSENILRTTAAASSSTSQRVLSSGFRKYP